MTGSRTVRAGPSDPHREDSPCWKAAIPILWSGDASSTILCTGPGCDEPVDTVVRRERARRRSLGARWRAGPARAVPGAGRPERDGHGRVHRWRGGRRKDHARARVLPSPRGPRAGPAGSLRAAARATAVRPVHRPCRVQRRGARRPDRRGRKAITRWPVRCCASSRSDATPSLVVLEDLHWADEATLDVLRLTARRLAGVGALILLTYRNDELGRWHPLRVLIGELGASQTIVRMSLVPLSLDAVKSLAGRFDWRRRGALPPHGRQPVLRHRAAGRRRGDGAGQRRRRRPGPGGSPEPERPPAAGGDRRGRPAG